MKLRPLLPRHVFDWLILLLTCFCLTNAVVMMITGHPRFSIISGVVTLWCCVIYLSFVHSRIQTEKCINRKTTRDRQGMRK